MKNESAHRVRPPAVEPVSAVESDAPEDETLLARWLFRAMEAGPRFWLMVVGLGVMTVALVMLVNTLNAGDTTRSAGWEELFRAESPEAVEKVAETFPKSPAAQWARLQAAGARFREGSAKLATDRTAAKPLLKKALDDFQEVADSAPKGSTQARLAAVGVAQAYEARNELSEAITQYRKVAADWPGTEEGKSSTKRADLLGTPEAVDFYKQLYAYKAPETTLPPGGKRIFDLPNLPGFGAGGSSTQVGPMTVLPPPSPTPEASKGGLPDDLPALTPPSTDEPAPAPADAEKAAEPEPKAKAGELPGEPFAPAPPR